MPRRKEEQEQQPVIDEALIGEFARTFTPTQYEWDADIVFDAGQLRDFFCCWRAFGDTLPDPLPTYIKRLSELGFHRIIGSEAQPIIPVCRKK